MLLNTPTESALWRVILQSLEARSPLVIATVVRDSGSVPRRVGSKMLVKETGSILGSVGGGLFEALVIQDALAALKERKSQTKGYSFNPKGSHPQAFGAVCGGRVEIFLEVVMPPDRLLIVGGGHCGKALARLASQLDFEIIIADDRPEYARREDFDYPNVVETLAVSSDYSDLPLPDANVYVALVSKGYLTDEAALRRILHAPAAYIGMMGSVRKRETVFENLRRDGVSEESLARIHAPIGIEIGAETPEEIALSILAEIVRERAQKRQRLPSIE